MTTTPDLLSDPATDPFAVAEQAAAVIAERTGAERHDVALVLGSGWGQTADLVGETLATVDQAEVPGFHGAAVAGHSSSIRSVAFGDTFSRRGRCAPLAGAEPPNRVTATFTESTNSRNQTMRPLFRRITSQSSKLASRPVARSRTEQCE